MLGERAGTAGLMALSVRGHFVVSLLYLISHPDHTRGLPNIPGVSRGKIQVHLSDS